VTAPLRRRGPGPVSHLFQILLKAKCETIPE
jgi:hypothetical protein